MALPNRKLPRLHEYDYSTPGAYFITICTHEKSCLFGRILPGVDSVDAYMQYSPIGEIARECLLDIASHYDNIKVDKWVIMPNHVHMLIQITERIEPQLTIRYDIPNVIGKYKAAVTRKVGKALIYSGKLWQSSYYDHIIRNQEDYLQIWQYISGNPSKWLDDCFFSE